MSARLHDRYRILVLGHRLAGAAFADVVLNRASKYPLLEQLACGTAPADPGAHSYHTDVVADIAAARQRLADAQRTGTPYAVLLLDPGDPEHAGPAGRAAWWSLLREHPLLQAIAVLDPGAPAPVRDADDAATADADDRLLIARRPGKRDEARRLVRVATRGFDLRRQLELQIGVLEDQVRRRTRTIARTVDELEREVERRAAAEERLRRAARHDVLTDLPNRAVLDETLAAACVSNVPADRRAAVMFVDLDGFKLVNDRLGHRTGDGLLHVVADRLRHVADELRRAGCARRVTVARFGGDEFAVALADLPDPGRAAEAARRLTAALNDRVTVGPHRLQLRASVGVAVTRAGDTDPADLLRYADIALYRVKSRRPGGWAVFDGELRERARRGLVIERDLPLAGARGQLGLQYQPIVGVADGEIRGCEALLRWTHPELGPVGPDEFIAVAERSDLISELGRWILTEACRGAAAWPAAGDGPPPAVCVNVSPRQLFQDRIVDDVRDALNTSGLDPRRLKLEITENVFMHDDPTVAERIEACRALGVGFHLDDFGVGYSSLTRLHALPVDTLKIDRSFVARLDAGEGHGSIVRAVVGLARDRGLTVVAEGVETAGQHDRVRQLGCDLAQGFLFARPLDPAALHDRLAAAPRPAAPPRAA